MLPCGAPGAQGPAPPGCPCAMLGASKVCGAIMAPHLPGLGHYAPLARAAFGLRLPFRHRCAGQPVARLAALPIGHSPRPSLGARRPPAGLAAPVGGSVPGSVGSRCGCALALLRPALCRVGRACLAAGLLPPCRRRPAQRLPPAALVSLAPPAGGRGGCGRGQARAFYGFAAAARPARLGSAAAGEDYVGMLACGILLCYDYDSSTTVR